LKRELQRLSDWMCCLTNQNMLLVGHSEKFFRALLSRHVAACLALVSILSCCLYPASNCVPWSCWTALARVQLQLHQTLLCMLLLLLLLVPCRCAAAGPVQDCGACCCLSPACSSRGGTAVTAGRTLRLLPTGLCYMHHYASASVQYTYMKCMYRSDLHVCKKKRVCVRHASGTHLPLFDDKHSCRACTLSDCAAMLPATSTTNTLLCSLLVACNLCAV
jgi:hypothetical protein